MRTLPDEAWRTAGPWIVAGLAILVLAVKWPTLGAPAWWDEMGWMRQAAWLSENGVLRVLPGTRPDAAFWGHPPGLHLTAAIPFMLTGPSRWVAHLVIAGFAAVGVCATFLLGRLWYDARTGALAALTLLLTPAYFAQAGLFLADLPVAALAVLCAYLAVTQRYLAYLLVASYMVMLKETAMAVVAAVALLRVLSGHVPVGVRVVEAMRYAAPLLVIGGFIALQKLVTGRAFFIFDFAFEPFTVTSPGAVARQALAITRWLFVDQFRWVLTLAVVLDLVVHRASVTRPALLLLALVVPLSGYAFSVMYFVPRYVLPVLPFFCVVAAGAALRLARSGNRRTVVAVAVPALMAIALLRESAQGSGETDLSYLRGMEVHRAMARTIAERHPDARILTEWPNGLELDDPLYGYVERPLRVLWYRPDEPLPQAELALVSSPANARMDALARVAERAGWTVMSRMADAGFTVTLYATGLPAER